MEPLEQDVDNTFVNNMESWNQLSAEEDPSQLQQQTLVSSGTDSQDRLSVCPDEQLSIVGESSKPSTSVGFESLHLEFQDSRLSPALTLLPQEKSFVFSESTLLHQTHSEFVPLRGSPDFSIVSERCPQLSHLDLGVQSTLQHTLQDQTSLSQHPLGETAVISEGDNSYCSLSQHSLSPESHYQTNHNEVKLCALENKGLRLMEGEEQNEMDKGETDVCASSKSAPARTLLGHLDNVADVLSAMTSSSETALSQTDAVSAQTDLVHEQNTVWSSAEKMQFKPSLNREQPQGGYSSSISQRKITRPSDVSPLSRESATSFITVRSSSMHSDRTPDPSLCKPENSKQNENKDTLATKNVTSACGGGVTGPERALWSSASQTGVDVSFLSPQPVSQSTPAVLPGRAPQTVTKLSPIYSYRDIFTTVATAADKRTSKQSQITPLQLSTPDQMIPVASHQIPTELTEAYTEYHLSSNQKDLSTGIESSVFTSKDIHPVPDSFLCLSGTQFKDHKPMLSVGRVHSLPSLSYLQKVDAWKANQSSSMSFCDNLALQGFDSIPKKKVQESLSEPSHHTPTQPRPQLHSLSSAFSAKTCLKPPQPTTEPSRPGSGSPRRSDIAAVAGAVASPLTQSHSHSSLSTVVTSIQREEAQHRLQLSKAPSDSFSSRPSSAEPESLQLPSEKSPTDQLDTVIVPVKPNPLPSLGQLSDAMLHRNMASAFSSSQGSYHGEQSLRASMGAASSVVSLEVDNYAPYWTSRPGSPPRVFELNIEDRIPMYLRNLGIDQSPSTILNPFTPRGPIREPEFSPTDLCTIKGSVGTPTKSTQPSEGDSPQKETFSSSSAFSVDSAASQRFTEQEPDRPVSPGSVSMVGRQVATPTELHSSLQPLSVPQEALTPQREGSYGLQAQASPGSVPTPGSWVDVEEGDSSLMGSATLQEIRRLLGRAESLVSGRSSLTSLPGSHILPKSDTSFPSPQRNTQGYRDDSALFVGGKTSLVLARSSSDSALKKSSSSSFVPLKLFSQTDHISTTPLTPSQNKEEDMKSRDLRVAPRRAEPEGCSAADPDRVGPVSLPVMQVAASPLADDQQRSQESSQTVRAISPENSLTRSPAEIELGVLSDSGSESSLAARVAKLLQSESPVSMVTSRPSTTDPEESRAREWILMKASGSQCESLDLNAEDRKRIEEIKQELLLHTKQAKTSSDSEDSVSAQSSIGAAIQPVGGFVSVGSPKQLQDESVNLLDAAVPTLRPQNSDLEAKVHQIALREGINLYAPLTSISITSCRTPSSQASSYRLLTQDDLTGTGPLQGPSHSTNVQTRPPADDKSQQTVMSTRGMETAVEEKNGTDKYERQESKITDLPAFQELACDDGTDKREISLESGTAASPKLQMSQIHVTLYPKPQPDATQRSPSPVRKLSKMQTISLTRKLSKMQTISLTHLTERLTGENPLRGTSVSSGSEEGRVSVLSETSSSKDKPTGQVCEAGGVEGYSHIEYPHTFSAAQKRLTGPSQSLSVHAAAVPTLLPYKPHGSSELFYMPQTEPALSPVRSDTTIESSHPGSDDAVPPCFNTEVLGSREQDDNNVTLKHKEGIYSKRTKMNNVSTMSGRGLYDRQAAAFNRNDGIGSVYQLASPSTSRNAAKGLDEVQRPTHFAERFVDEEEEFAPLHMEADYSTDDLHHRGVPKDSLASEARLSPSKAFRKEEQAQTLQKASSVDVNLSLDQLWQRFNEKWGLRESQPTSEEEMPLLERLERLSRLLHCSTPPRTPAKQVHSLEERAKVTREHERKKTEGKATRKGEKRDGIEATVPQPAWQEKPTRISQILEEQEQENVHRWPAEKDESASVSVETSSTRSTIDTQRLLKAFGPHRLSSAATRGQTLKARGSLLRLYNTINKQKSENGIDISEHPLLSVASERMSTDDSMTSADSSSSSIRLFTSQKEPLSTKRPKVKLVSRGIQAGDLEIVVNGTRRHTRDVGTTFPSPGSSPDVRVPPEAQKSSIPEPTASCTSSHYSQTVLKGLSWFVVTDEPKQLSRKENEPHDKMEHAWFEPYSRTQPWREPLRERHLQVEREKPPVVKASTEADNDKPSALVHLSLKEALELHHPEFVSRSRERMKRLCLLAEERKMQAVFNREREEIFNRPLVKRQPAAVTAPLPSKRVIPVKEMVQRSKRIYHQLPEVRKRHDEERRKAEYRSYRLRAQVFNKKVTSRVLGRRPPWH